MKDFCLRDLQLLELRMLKDVTDFCDKNDIAYFLDAGTLLGAVRHRGFIPWDDDIDICMNIKNYRKFLRLAPKGLPSQYFCQNFRTDSKLGINWSRVRINGTTSMEKNMTSYDIHYGVCMDIFVMSGLAESAIGRRIQKTAGCFLSVLLEKYSNIAAGFKMSNKLAFFYRCLPDTIRLILARITERIFFIDTQKTRMCYNTWYMNRPDETIPKLSSKSYSDDNRIRLKFEDFMFWVPKNYEEILEKQYGDWKKMPPLEERNGHGDLIVDLEKDYREYYTGK